MEWEEWIGPAIGAITLLTLLGVITKKAWRLGRKANHVLDDLLGSEARPGHAAQPGVVEAVAHLRVRQEEIAGVALDAASDARAAREELSSGDNSTKELVTKALESSERTEALMRRHMVNGAAIMDVGLHNDAIIVAAIEALGGHMEAFRAYPQVDDGED